MSSVEMLRKGELPRNETDVHLSTVQSYDCKPPFLTVTPVPFLTVTPAGLEEMQHLKANDAPGNSLDPLAQLDPKTPGMYFSSLYIQLTSQLL